jgi:hypothetical protein
MRIGRGNRSTQRKPAPVPLFPSQIPHDLTWDRTRAATVGSQRLTAWAVALPLLLYIYTYLVYTVTRITGCGDQECDNEKCHYIVLCLIIFYVTINKGKLSSVSNSWQCDPGVSTNPTYHRCWIY